MKLWTIIIVGLLIGCGHTTTDTPHSPGKPDTSESVRDVEQHVAAASYSATAAKAAVQAMPDTVAQKPVALGHLNTAVAELDQAAGGRKEG